MAAPDPIPAAGPSTGAARASRAAGVHYRITPADPNAHLFTVVLTVARPAAGQQLSLPAWIPGSYLIRDFAKSLQQLQARQGRRAVPLRQLDKHCWQADCAPGQALQLSYSVCAHDRSVRAAWLDAGRGFFNGTSLCLRVHGQERTRHTLEIAASAATAHWSVATALPAAPGAQAVDARGFGRYAAADYDELVDCPVELGSFWSGRFDACGVPHRFVVAGAAASFDGARLLADTRRICAAAIAFWHGAGQAPPQRSYLFLLNAMDSGYGGLEHRNSCALLCARRDLPRCLAPQQPQGAGYDRLLGLISHEYFHAWNVKRLRPAEFSGYDYGRENHTGLLWFFEGFTSYYDELLLLRAGLIDSAAYLRRLGKTINQLLQTPGRALQSAAQASFDAWTRFYRPDENTPNATVSYYGKGALIALCLDLTLRREGRSTLDAVMRALWLRCNGGAMTEADLRAVLHSQSGRAFDSELDAWVHGRGELPLAPLLAAHGVAMRPDCAQPAQRLGLRVRQGHAGVRIETVLRGSAAESAGLAAGDEWLGVELQGQGWRIHRIDDLACYTGAETAFTALVARDARLLRLPVQLAQALQAPAGQGQSGAAPDTISLSITDPAAAARWLDASENLQP